MNGVYEDVSVLNEYLLFHYGSEEEILAGNAIWPQGMRDALDFAVRTPSHFSDREVARGLDLGCAVGRSTFEMSRHCEHVIGIDYSNGFITAAKDLQQKGFLDYFRKEEAMLISKLTAKLPEGVLADRVEFLQGDAMRLPEDLGEFDRVHAANLLCRLSAPCLLLSRFPELVKKGGELVLVTPCTWLEQFTPVQNWPKASTMDWLKENLHESFELIKETEEQFLIRETARKFQWTKSMLTVWVRR